MRWVVVGSGLAYGALGAALSATSCEARGDDVQRVAPLREVKGTVKAVDTGKRTVEVELRGRRTTFSIDEETVFFWPGRQADFEDLSEGQEVRLVFEPGTVPTLQWIEFSPVTGTD